MIDVTVGRKQFLAFVNKVKRDRYWIDGNMTMDDHSPKVYPYDTPEEKAIVYEIGRRLGVWCETSDVEAVILILQPQVLPIITKEQALLIEEEIMAKADEEALEKKIALYETKRVAKEKKLAAARGEEYVPAQTVFAAPEPEPVATKIKAEPPKPEKTEPAKPAPAPKTKAKESAKPIKEVPKKEVPKKEPVKETKPAKESKLGKFVKTEKDKK